MWLVLELNPEPWAIGPLSVIRRGGKYIPVVGRNAQLANYKDAIADAVGKQEEITGKVKITFYFWRQRSDYETPQAIRARKHEVDATNMQKATEDALQGIFYANDKDVSDVRAVIVEQGPTVTPRIVIHVVPWLGLDPSEIPNEVWSQIDNDPTLFDAPKEQDSNYWGGPS